MADAEVDYGRVWRETIHSLDGDGLPQRQRAFLGLSKLVGVLQNLAIISTPNPLTKGVIEDQIGAAVRGALSRQLGANDWQDGPSPAGTDGRRGRVEDRNVEWDYDVDGGASRPPMPRRSTTSATTCKD